MEWLITLIGLVVLALPVMLVIALVLIFGLRQRVSRLEGKVAALESSVPADTVAAASMAVQEYGDEPYDAVFANGYDNEDQQQKDAMESSHSIAEARMDAAAERDDYPEMEPVASVPPPLPGSFSSDRGHRRVQPGKSGVERAPSEFLERLSRSVKGWFTEGNIPVKIGVLVLFAGVAALLKYVSDQGWLTVPIELRLTGVAAAALGALLFAWRKREHHHLFALSIQGGAIGVLLLTVFAAFSRYSLLPVSAAFGLSVALIAGAGILAVLQNARVLAVFAILAGFLAPIWLSTGSGNHVALFSYYAILNVAILGIAWWRSWRGLNLLGFGFTFGIGTIWGMSDYRVEKFASTEPFLLLFFAFYLLIPILYARKRVGSQRDVIDGSLVFGTPLIAFLLQAGLLEFERLPLAFCALGLGGLYLGLAAVFLRRENFVSLGQAYAVLAIGFATLAVPLALSAQNTACIFAVEGAALIWVGLRQRRLLPQIGGVGLQLMAAIAFGYALADSHGYADTIFANASFMSALLIALAGLASAWCYRNAKITFLSVLFYLWGISWWCGNALHEIHVFIPEVNRADAALVIFAVTGWLAAEVHRRRGAMALGMTTLLAFVAAGPLLLEQSRVHDYPFAGYGLIAWCIYAVLGIRSLLCLRDSDHRLAGYVQFVWWSVWALALSMLSEWLGRRFDLDQGWSTVAIILPWLSLWVSSRYRWRWIAAPLGERFDSFRSAFQGTIFAVLSIWWLYALFQPGGSAPLPWVPLLNPMELTQLAILLLA
ncbi:MAG: DUF2339 domain-containing protein, partial [Xanthomonadaceae bacterium]|nr:DUF2339 domain-containing protein [Xanthomonadaceae bacterium]